MAKPDLGKRFRCFSCGCAFYDLGKSPAICPRCGANQAAAPKFSVPTGSKSSSIKDTPLRLGVEDEDELEGDLADEFDEFGNVGLDDDDVEISEEED
jgi:hypothetical protein